nr:ergothioneine biosynthesis protein EgtB [Rheinheimera sp.]
MTPSAEKWYQQVRQQTLALTEGLSAEDMVVQSMPDASPAKWHLAHTSWFFEHFILQPYFQNYQCFNHHYQYLFNSYYDTVGSRHARPQRGLLSRPPLSDIMQYRQHVDSHISILLRQQHPAITDLLTIGLHHEMQHQELLLTDILHLLSHNPLAPALLAAQSQPSLNAAAAVSMICFDGGMAKIGAEAGSFSYDCENPRHSVYLAPFKLAHRPVTNAEWQDFISDGGYQNPLLWLSDGWHYCQSANWQAPLYWRNLDQQ